jgi:ankyrin repeat protein
VYKYILKNVLDRNPRDDTGQTPLHVALSGRLTKQCSLLNNANLNKEVFKFILENIDDKNPEDNNGVTPKLLSMVIMKFLSSLMITCPKTNGVYLIVIIKKTP